MQIPEIGGQQYMSPIVRLGTYCFYYPHPCCPEELLSIEEEVSIQ